MNELNQFKAVCRALFAPGFYPHAVTRLERRETHISVVFLTGKWAYKLKKPLNLGFLDFRGLESRRRFCELEISLNKRLSRGVYHSVVTIYQTPDGQLTFKKGGRIAEYAVKMKQLPEEASLGALLRSNRMKPRLIKKLGRMLADFYAMSRRNGDIDRFGQSDVIARNMNENFEQIVPFAGKLFSREKWEVICQVCRSFFDHRTALFENRIAAGKIRDGHGDLRTDHIYFYRGIQIIDCIEFNDRFRYGDIAADLAFLHMDLAHSGFPEWSRIFLDAYMDHADDLQVYALIDFYATYRAVVRLKVSCFGLSSAGATRQHAIKKEIRRYLDQAYQYAVMFSRPTLWVFCGLPATGKSSLAAQTAESLFSTLLISDLIRREQQSHMHPEIGSFGKGIYREEMRQLVYSQLFGEALEKLKGGSSVVLDATFSRRKWRDEARQLAADLDIDIVFVECRCSRRIIRTRLKERETAGGPSDARLRHLSAMIKNFEPPDELPPEIHLVINTCKPLKVCLIEILSGGYARKCLQVKKKLST